MKTTFDANIDTKYGATALLAEAWQCARALVGDTVDLANLVVGLPQRSGALTVVPLFRTRALPHSLGAPGTTLTLQRVRTYGDVELRNKSTTERAIAPLHMGFIQQGAQNHALCRSALLEPGKTERFTDACCVQSGQGGYLEGKDQWFFVLPLSLRETALELRNKTQYSKLWPAISELSKDLGLPERGHLEQLLTRQRAHLTQYRSRLELEPEQTGALFFLRERLVGIEIAPSPAFFADLWMPLVCFAYGVPAYAEERKAAPEAKVVPFPAANLAELRRALEQSRAERDAAVACWLAESLASAGVSSRQREAQSGKMCLFTVSSQTFTGQIVTDAAGAGETLLYASLFARRTWMDKCRIK